jgi:inner membrane protease subunit 1
MAARGALLGAAALGVVAVDALVVSAELTAGPSMLPTLARRGNVLLATPLLPLEEGSIVIARDAGGRRVCKRLLFASGARPRAVRVADGRSVVLPPHSVWLEGDNKADSLDSRAYGALPQAAVSRVVVCQLWPPSRAQMLI